MAIDRDFYFVGTSAANLGDYLPVKIDAGNGTRVHAFSHVCAWIGWRSAVQRSNDIKAIRRWRFVGARNMGDVMNVSMTDRELLELAAKAAGKNDLTHWTEKINFTAV